MTRGRSLRFPASKSVTLDINLLGRDYKVACKEHERAELMDAVAFLDSADARDPRQRQDRRASIASR